MFLSDCQPAIQYRKIVHSAYNNDGRWQGKGEGVKKTHRTGELEVEPPPHGNVPRLLGQHFSRLWQPVLLTGSRTDRSARQSFFSRSLGCNDAGYKREDLSGSASCLQGAV